MRLQRTLLITAGGATASGAAATVAWSGASGTSSVRERLAGAGYAPALLGLATVAVAGPASLVPAARAPAVRRFAIPALGLGGTAFAGVALGTLGARLLGADPRPTIFADADLPAADHAAAQAEANSAYAMLDRSKDDLVILVPGTMRFRVPEEFEIGMRAASDSVSIAKLPTHRDYQVPNGVATSAEAVQLLVARLDAERRPGQRILLAAESQGSWALGVALGDAKTHAAIDRAVLWANPGVSPHQFDGPVDSKVLELSDELDTVGRQLEGDAPMLLAGTSRTFDGDPTQAWRMFGTLINNPHEALLIATTGARLLTPGGYGRDPHNHREFMDAAARFLADAPARD